MRPILLIFFILTINRRISAIIPYYHFPIEGTLQCEPDAHTKLAVNAVVEVWEHDVVTWDDFITTANVTAGNRFRAMFEHSEIGSVSPYLIIYHDCNEEVVYEKCYAKTIYPIEHHHEQDLGETVEVDVDLLNVQYNTTIICDWEKYPLTGKPPQFNWLSYKHSAKQMFKPRVTKPPRRNYRPIE